MCTLFRSCLYHSRIARTENFHEHKITEWFRIFLKPVLFFLSLPVGCFWMNLFLVNTVCLLCVLLSLSTVARSKELITLFGVYYFLDFFTTIPPLCCTFFMLFCILLIQTEEKQYLHWNMASSSSHQLHIQLTKYRNDHCTSFTVSTFILIPFR